jgi:hypothetical protein
MIILPDESAPISVRVLDLDDPPARRRQQRRRGQATYSLTVCSSCTSGQASSFAAVSV